MTTIAHPSTLSHRRARRLARTRPLPRLSRRANFWAVAFAFDALTAFATDPSALYGLFAQREHVAPITLTIVCAVCAIGVVASLLLAGHLSDAYGRRTVLIPGMLVAGVALQYLSPRVTLLIFAAAVGLGVLAAAPLLVNDPQKGTQS